MVSMDKKQQILHYYRVDRLSLREISRRVSLDRKTVRRIVRGYEEAVAQDPETGDLTACIIGQEDSPSDSPGLRRGSGSGS